VYWFENKISSTALRPYTVYGIGRDQGLTSEPTKAMLAAAAGQPYRISFGGTMQFQSASDVANQFIDAAQFPLDGAYTFNLGGAPTTVTHAASLILRAAPDAEIEVADKALPFPTGFDDTELRRHFATVYETPLDDGIRQTVEHFRMVLADGRLTV